METEEYEGAGIAIRGRKLAQLRRARPWSRTRLAAEAGLSVHTVKAYERGVRKPRAESLAALCAALGCDPAELTGDGDERADGVV